MQADSLWNRLQAALDSLDKTPPKDYLRQFVADSCERNAGCRLSLLAFLVEKLERRFDLVTAISLSEDLALLAQKEGDYQTEAQTYRDLYRFHDALGNKGRAIVFLDKAIEVFDQIGQKDELLVAQLVKIESSIDGGNIGEAIPKMEQLFDSAVSMKATHIYTSLLQVMIDYAMEAGLYEKAEGFVQNLEEIPVSKPLKKEEYGTVIFAVLGRADLALVRGQLDSAHFYYKKALQLCEEEPSKWLEIYVLQALSQLSFDGGDRKKAWTWIRSAQEKAENLNLDDHLATCYEVMARFAEADGEYKDALDFTHKMHFHKTKFEERGANFSPRSYYLQLEKEQLATEKENKELELQLKESQLLAIAIFSLLLGLITFLLIIAYVTQKRRKNFLAEQNSLISRQAEQLKELDSAKNRFFANVSHELRTPLGLVLGPISTLINDPKFNQKNKELLAMARQSIFQLQLLVNEILDLGKLDLGKMEVQKEVTELGPLFYNYALRFESLALQKNISYTYHSEVDSKFKASVDQEKLRQILSNLLSNAFKFTPEGGTVRASLTLEGDQLAFSVEDSGPGIHQDDLTRLFERYFQTNHPEKAVLGGSGIGLTLSQEYARLLGGEIAVESELGKGSRFTLYCPINKAEGIQPLSGSHQVSIVSAAEPEAEPPQTLESGKLTLLLVEDNEGFQAYLQAILSEKYNLIVASNGKIALEKLESYPACDLVISDLMMPVMNGFELLRKLKGEESRWHIPVLMMTARAEKEDRLQALRVGVDDYLVKPFEEDELLARIENLLNNHSSRMKERARDFPQLEKAQDVTSEDQEWLGRFEAYVRKRISEKNLSVPELAEEFAMSESSLLRQVKRLTGLSPIQYLKAVRLQEARTLLEQQKYSSVSRVADLVGYKESRSFSKAFKKHFGKLPSNYLRKTS